VPAVVGEILAGVILGPAILNYIQPSAIFSSISEISLFFIILYIGIEATTDTFRAGFGKSIILTMTSFIIPVLIMIYISFDFLSLNITESIVLSIAIGVPSISIISVLLKDNGILKMNAGNLILASVILSDIIALAVTSISLDPKKIYVEVPGIVIFLVLVVLIDRTIRKNSDRVMGFFDRIHAMERGEKIIFGAIIVGALFVSLLFELIGVTYVLGAFFAGMLISDVVLGEDLNGKVKRTLSRLNDSFFIPIFFSIAGLDATIPGGGYVKILVVLVLLSAGIGGTLNYLASKKMIRQIRPRMTMGILGSRGAIGIIVASLALYQPGISTPGRSISASLYSVAIFGILILSIAFASLVRKEDVVDASDSDN
jgi:Kef-type K+ transport system membrane component KefB